MFRRPLHPDTAALGAAGVRAPAAGTGAPSHAASQSGVTAVLSLAVRAARVGQAA